MIDWGYNGGRGDRISQVRDRPEKALLPVRMRRQSDGVSSWSRLRLRLLAFVLHPHHETIRLGMVRFCFGGRHSRVPIAHCWSLTYAIGNHQAGFGSRNSRMPEAVVLYFHRSASWPVRSRVVGWIVTVLLYPDQGGRFVQGGH